MCSVIFYFNLQALNQKETPTSCKQLSGSPDGPDSSNRQDQSTGGMYSGCHKSFLFGKIVILTTSSTGYSYWCKLEIECFVIMM